MSTQIRVREGGGGDRQRRGWKSRREEEDEDKGRRGEGAIEVVVVVKQNNCMKRYQFRCKGGRGKGEEDVGGYILLIFFYEILKNCIH